MAILSEEARAPWEWASRPYWLTWTWWRGWAAPPNHEADPEFQEAQQWVLDLAPAGEGREEAYGVVLKATERLYEQTVKLAEATERKADDLMKIAATIGAALVAAMKLLGPDPSGSRSLVQPGSKLAIARSVLMSISVACLVLTVLVAAIMKRSTVTASSMNGREMIRMVGEAPLQLPKTDMEAIAAATLHSAFVGMQILSNWKALQLKRATFLFAFGLVPLLPAAVIFMF